MEQESDCMTEKSIAYCGLICDLCNPNGGCNCKNLRIAVARDCRHRGVTNILVVPKKG